MKCSLPEIAALRERFSMNCPGCKTAMISGSLVIDHVISPLLTTGTSDHDLFFKEPDQKRINVLGAGFTREGFHCASCGAVFIKPPPSEEADKAKCGQCGISLRPNHTNCHWCGWKPSVSSA